MTCTFRSIASPASVYSQDCRQEARYEVVDRLAPLLERRQRSVCADHARFMIGQGFWIFPLGEDEAESLRAEQIR